ncbi:hypothetical protein AA313_de0209664 [Arthrobotrys entomopaga]|nr:hypothetical protein AA313_de0209664 [Arthrobotrys entomopaga]
MDEDKQQQFHHSPVPVSAKDAASIAAAVSVPVIADEAEDSLDGASSRKKRPDLIQQTSSNSAIKSGQSSRSHSNERSGSNSRRSRTPVPNPNTGPQPDEELEVIFEDDQKKVVIVNSGGILGKLRVIRKDTVAPPSSLQLPSVAGPGPSPLRNAANASDSGKLDLPVDAPTPE